MTDDLRDRIAAALAAEFEGQAQKFDEASWGDVADVVIAELNILKEDGECSYCHAQLPGCRYICDWKTE